jgi:glycosyltransferase involved in cell wall biosynthesis
MEQRPTPGGSGPELLSIVLPVHNQADHIEPIVLEYLDGLRRVRRPFEVLLVVNGSRDRSLEVCAALAERHPEVRAINSAKGGWGLAVRLGLEAAHGDLLCYTNSARTRAPDLILALLFAVANPGAVVKAHRRSRETFTRKVGSFLYNLECRVLFDLPTWDINATPKVFSRAVYERMRLTEDGDLLDLELYAECRRLGTSILEVPVYAKHRHSGESTTTYRSAVRMYSSAFRRWRSVRARRLAREPRSGRADVGPLPTPSAERD